jgi:hypothetical protein
MNLKDAIKSLEEVKEYFRDLMIELAEDKSGLRSDRFADMIFRTYCSLEMAYKPFKPLDDVLCFDDSE